ncbi:hypothetical protein ACFYM2_04485 [Streptomyces sp. NPDC006711]|uniref:hypothetical protein n=1 Tax=Streptomyces sp. NPDC006711 TaxID=3364762 RepID=UPI0036ACF437
MINFRFCVRPGQGTPSGFDLGDLVCEGHLGEASSVGHVPDQGMMIYLSVTQLLDDLGDFLTGAGKELTFTGVDTSFELVFRQGKKEISVAWNEGVIARVSRGDLAESVAEAASELANSGLALLPLQDAVRVDYLAALHNFLTTAVSP